MERIDTAKSINLSSTPKCEFQYPSRSTSRACNESEILRSSNSLSGNIDPSGKLHDKELSQDRISTTDSKASICLANLNIEGQDEDTDTIVEDEEFVQQAAPMVLSLEKPEESTLEVLQLEVARESDSEDGSFDESEQQLYKIQPRVDPIPID